MSAAGSRMRVLTRGLLLGLCLAAPGRIASLMGAIKIAHAGTQEHRFTLPEFRQQYRAAFGGEL